MPRIADSECKLVMVIVRDLFRAAAGRGESPPEPVPAYVVRTGWGYSVTLSRELAATGSAWAHFADLSPGWQLEQLIADAEWAAEQLDRRPADPKTREVTL
jgi:hypothetical protein